MTVYELIRELTGFPADMEVMAQIGRYRPKEDLDIVIDSTLDGVEINEYEQGYVSGAKDMCLESESDFHRGWLFSSIENPTFMICPFCGESYRTDLPIKIVFCTACGKKPGESVKNGNN